ncbi:MAG: DUF3109 family protein [Bacteroidales bacterium]|jgi:hypothetical protein|nr:DUF3109 family protein [Bacteroidales bacterium]
MIQVGEAIVSLDVFEKKFVCNIPKCKGMCCVYGESGAPLEEGEVAILEQIYPKVKPYMTQEGIDVIEKGGVYVTDFDDDKVTPLVGVEDCAYACSEKGIIFCAIEKAYLNGEIDFRKPVSCHLYPIRITKYTDFEAVNYHQWNICSDALKLGEKSGTPLYVFLKEPLIRKYGEEWYDQLCIAAGYLSQLGK